MHICFFFVYFHMGRGWGGFFFIFFMNTRPDEICFWNEEVSEVSSIFIYIGFI